MKKIFDNQIYLKIRRLGIRTYLYLFYPIELKQRAKAAANKDRIKIVFFAVDVAMWRYQKVYEMLLGEKRFDCFIVLSVANGFNHDQQLEHLKQMRSFFSKKGIHYIDYDEFAGIGYDVKCLIDPDILFYPQPYEDFLPAEHSYNNFKDKLWCYCPYGFYFTENIWNYDLLFHNLAWKLYAPFLENKTRAKKLAKNRGRNVLVSGYTNLDEYMSSDVSNPWKINDMKHKRLIWAPHFTIADDITWLGGRSNFLSMAQMMLDVAEKFKDRLQIAFKPHPRLKSELYKHPEWGREKTDEYYNKWAGMDNTQLEVGGFIDLFKTSDAMIHDSGSFIVEYLFLNKPVAFVSNDYEKLLSENVEFVCNALEQHYIVKNEEEILSFISDVVLGGDDPKRNQRTEYYKNILKPNATGSVSQFIVNDLKSSLGIK